MKHEKVWYFEAPVGENKKLQLVSIILDDQRKARLEQTMLEKKFEYIVVRYHESTENQNH